MADSSPAEPVTKKPKLDLWLSVSDDDSDEYIGDQVELSIDLMKTENPAEYQKILDICKLALTHYQDSHPGKSYELESVHKGFIRPVAGLVYSLTFRAKNMMEDGNLAETFQAVAYDFIGKKLKIVECELLK